MIMSDTEGRFTPSTPIFYNNELLINYELVVGMTNYKLLHYVILTAAIQ